MKLRVSCTNRDCARGHAGIYEVIALEEIAPGVIAKPRLLCAVCGGELWEERDEPRCPAHGCARCDVCSQNVGDTCDQCEYYAEIGMHWDTCANRIRGLVTRRWEVSQRG